MENGCSFSIYGSLNIFMECSYEKTVCFVNALSASL